ncbi:hypothetical protein BTJ40_13540 [Microbulbifer sp. A4B17]|uniref:hypothetical protein n=1 Tax=Microbulbifer sp. A4B17 TaxID=359370 RepID=UPI000D52E1F5|nr:hypothetical protein [Microbulbifer sp. A4B17]AWF81765.1 hypothetical protein BTJ40_13540 [Microbulbifer sp. A4B17]
MKLQDSTGLSNLLKVTNQSGHDIVVITPVTSDPTSAGDAKVYNQDLKILTLKEGGTVIKKGESGTVDLDQSYTDSKTNQSLLYNYLISDFNWYYPIANLTIMQDLTNSSYPNQTITSDQAKSMSQAASFIQTIQAYPDSQLTEDYQTALSGIQISAQTAADGTNGSAQNVSNSITASVNNFFKSTDIYKDVTLAAVTAMQSYYDKFPFAWAQYSKTAVTYYLYGNDENKTTFQGTLVLTPPSTIDLTKANGGYTIKFNPAKEPSDTTTVDVDTSKAVSITYSDGLFISGTGSDVHQIVTQGVFMLKRTLTNVSSDTSIIPVMTGTVHDIQVIGFDNPQLSNAKSGSSDAEFWKTLFLSNISPKVLKSIEEVSGSLTMLGFTASLAYRVYLWSLGKGELNIPLSEAEFNAEYKKFQQESYDSASSKINELFEGKVEVPKSFQEALETVQGEFTKLSNNIDAAELEGAFDASREILKTLGNNEINMSQQQKESLQSIAETLKESSLQLNEAVDKQTELNQGIKDAKADLAEIGTNTGELTKDVSGHLSEQESIQISDNTQLIEDIIKNIDEISEINEVESESSKLELDEPIEPL